MKKRIDYQTFDAFTKAYVECMLWSSNDESTPNGGEPIDKNYGPEHLTQPALQCILEDCTSFQAANAELLAKAGTAEQNGHDFWLTRNRHGAGFWDRGYDKSIGKPLTDAAHAYGELHPTIFRKRIYL